MQSEHYDPGMVENPFFKIYITHLPTQSEISFRGWVTEFNDNFTSNWESQPVYGRMDPLATFSNTQRQISIGFDVVSGDWRQAMNNSLNVNRLIEFLYPVYENGARGVQNTLKASPLIGMRWSNLVANALNGQRLVGYLAGCSYAPKVEDGGFIIGNGAGGEVPHVGSAPGESRRVDESAKTYIPKTLSISLQYTVLHTHLPGWYNNSTPLPEGHSGPAEAANYLFGGEKIDGAFPNAFFRVGEVTTVSDASGSATSTQVRDGFRTRILDS